MLLSFEPPIQVDGWFGDVARAAKLEGRLRFFGHNAPDNVNVYLPPHTAKVTPWPSWVVEIRRRIARPHDDQLSARSAPHRYSVGSSCSSMPARRGAQAARCQRGQDADLPARLHTPTLDPADQLVIDQFTDTVTHVQSAGDDP